MSNTRRTTHSEFQKGIRKEFDTPLATQRIGEAVFSEINFNSVNVARSAALHPHSNNFSRELLQDIYTSMYGDSTISSSINSIVSNILQLPILVEDKKTGQPKEGAERLLRSAWMQKAVQSIVESYFFGYNLLLMDEFNTETGELLDVYVVPRMLVDPILRRITFPNNTTAFIDDPEYAKKACLFLTDYRSDDIYYMGAFLDMAQPYILKLCALSGFHMFLNKYNIPILIYQGIIGDATNREAFLENLKNIKSASVGHISASKDQGELQVHNVGEKASADNYIKMIGYGDKQLTLAILGSEDVNKEKAYVGSAKVGKELVDSRIMQMKNKVEYAFTDKIVPKLLELSPTYYAELQDTNIRFFSEEVMENTDDDATDKATNVGAKDKESVEKNVLSYYEENYPNISPGIQ